MKRETSSSACDDLLIEGELPRNMKQCCLKCHFLAKSTRSDTGHELRFTWNERERSQLRVDDHYAAQCAQGVWDTGIDPHLKAKLPAILQKKRRNSCFFIKHQLGMSFKAAEKLLALKAAKRSTRKATIALWISFVSLVTSGGLALISWLGKACM